MSEEKPEQDTQSALSSLACPICGKSDFEWGTTKAHYALTFMPQDAAGAGQWFGSAASQIRARKCSNCGNIQLFAVDKQ